MVSHGVEIVCVDIVSDVNPLERWDRISYAKLLTHNELPCQIWVEKARRPRVPVWQVKPGGCRVVAVAAAVRRASLAFKLRFDCRTTSSIFFAGASKTEARR